MYNFDETKIRINYYDIITLVIINWPEISPPFIILGILLPERCDCVHFTILL